VGFSVVVIETVGVGQVEVEIAGTADTTVVVVNPGWGDSVQANKAGLMEIADVFVINKADRDGARETKRDLNAMLDLGANRPWRPPIVETIAQRGQGVEELCRVIFEHKGAVEQSDEEGEKRRSRRRREFEESLVRRLMEYAYAIDGSEELVGRVDREEIDPVAAVDALICRMFPSDR
jgi:LAO/AO transport system kinase